MLAVVVTGGDQPPPSVLDQLDSPSVVIAADSGLGVARVLGLPVDVVVGDFDSVDPGELAEAVASGVVVERHPVAKDATDFELALEAATARGATRIVVVGGAGGRLDHFLANALCLASERLAGVTLDAWIGTARVAVVRDRADFRGAPGSLLTLLPVGGTARGVTTSNLRFPLADEDLPAGTTRGVSNEMEASTASVSVRDGVLLAVQPHALAPDALHEEST